VLDPANRRREVGIAGEAADEDVRGGPRHSGPRRNQVGTGMGELRARAILEHAADLFEERRALLMGLIVREAGRTIPKRPLGGFARRPICCAITPRRHGRILKRAASLPGITGEKQFSSRCVDAASFACIAPWNFPLSIFTGQVAAALAAGNSVLAKPRRGRRPSLRPPRFGSCTKPACLARCFISSRETGGAPSERSCSPIPV